MQTILITGAKGQVGQEFQYLSKASEFDFLFVDIEDLDITDKEAVISFFKENEIDFCVSCAAYTAVDKAESNAEIARKVNVDGVKNIAEGCALRSIPLIHLSTDYVYHNAQNTPFKEGDETNPQGIYAQTKLEGDEVALQTNAKTLILRTSWVYSSFGNNFVKTMIRLGRERDQLGVVFDQIGTPTYARDIANAILKLINQMLSGRQIQWGVYHFSNEGVTSWYDFAKAIFDIKGIDCEVKPIETKDYPTPAKRPPFSVLNKEKIKANFGIKVPHWRDSLKACLNLLPTP
ncbi:dTDP-4-dehydrorhamnose reductase [bacterium]|jgi:dTDP-4-dehydrorhamnose reductase|nr:dTDP-4-dehydrorhamnose reductase [Bacteroidota bacterium]MDA7625779.1 dTDP-4-dehydrorhamnose reductase [bacterium]MDF1865921.1 dTDP-4-dehydrorhamnose reductase [Saprospiraceae bacterium]